MEKAQNIIESVQPTEGVKEKLEKEYEAFKELRKDILDELNEEQKVQPSEEVKEEEELPHTCCTCRYQNLLMIEKPCADCYRGSEWKH